MPKESIPIEKAKEIILSRVRLNPPEEVYFSDSLGRHPYEDIVSPYSLPFRNNSAMDGFAVKSADLAAASEENPVKLPVVEELYAGKIPEKIVLSGTCARIFTGAAIPEGADAVVRQEDVNLIANAAIFKTPVEARTDIREKGEDIKEGQVFLKKGERICSAAIGMLAALRIKRIKVFRKPKVYLIATGNELADVESLFDENKIVNSNTHSLSAMLKELCAEPYCGGIVGDTKEAIRQSFQNIADCDMVITTGGISVGEYDLVKETFAELGVNWLFWKVKMRPGHPAAFGVMRDKLFFGLPGNPVSSMVTFDQFVRPAILKMSGVEDTARMRFFAAAVSDIKKKPGRTHFIRGVLSAKDGELFADAAKNQSSAAISAMISANCYIILEGEKTRIQKGEKVLVEVFKPW